MKHSKKALEDCVNRLIRQSQLVGKWTDRILFDCLSMSEGYGFELGQLQEAPRAPKAVESGAVKDMLNEWIEEMISMEGRIGRYFAKKLLIVQSEMVIFAGLMDGFSKDARYRKADWLSGSAFVVGSTVGSVFGNLLLVVAVFLVSNEFVSSFLNSLEGMEDAKDRLRRVLERTGELTKTVRTVRTDGRPSMYG